MPIGLIRLITTQKVLNTWSVKGVNEHDLGSNHTLIQQACNRSLRHRSFIYVMTFHIFVAINTF